MKRALLTAIAVCLAMPASAQEETALRLAPSSVWAVNYADETCELARTFGAGEQEVTLLFRTAEPGGRFFLSAYGRPVDMDAPTANVFTEFGEVEQLTPLFFAVKNASGLPGLFGVVPLSVGSVPNPRETVPLVGLPGVLAMDPANERRVEYVALRSVLDRDVILETGSMGEPLAALRACVDDLITRWGIDLDKHRALSRRVTPRTNPQTWIVSRDYPGGGRQNGFVNFRVLVDERGKVADCVVQGATLPESFAETACSRVSRRAEFNPALDASGQPIRSYYISSVLFFGRTR